MTDSLFATLRDLTFRLQAHVVAAPGAAATGSEQSRGLEISSTLCKEIVGALAQAEAVISVLRLLSEPRPIATAPKDGTKFWGLVDEDAIAIFWHPQFEAFVSSFRRMELAKGLTFEGGAAYQDHSPVVQQPNLWLPMRTKRPAHEKLDQTIKTDRLARDLAELDEAKLYSPEKPSIIEDGTDLSAAGRTIFGQALALIFSQSAEIERLRAGR